MKIFTNNDREIVKFVNEFRLVTIDHLERLTHRKTIWRRLPFLVQEKQIFKKERGLNEKYVYSCKPVNNRSLFTLEHDLMITETHVSLHLALGEHNVLNWQQGKDSWRNPVHQDAYCVLRNPQRPDGDSKIPFFIEADTGTENHQAIAAKLRTYVEYYDTQEKPFRVMFITSSLHRAYNLARLAETVVDKSKRKAYLFTDREQLRWFPLDKICLYPYGEREFLTILP